MLVENLKGKNIIGGKWQHSCMH